MLPVTSSRDEGKAPPDGLDVLDVLLTGERAPRSGARSSGSP